MDLRGALLRPGARARRAGLWLARTFIAASLLLLAARSLDVPIGLGDTHEAATGRVASSAPARPPSVGQDPSLMPSFQLPARLAPPPPAAAARSSEQPAPAGALVAAAAPELVDIVTPRSGTPTPDRPRLAERA